MDALPVLPATLLFAACFFLFALFRFPSFVFLAENLREPRKEEALGFFFDLLREQGRQSDGAKSYLPGAPF